MSSINDYVRNYIDELFKELRLEREQQSQYPEFVEIKPFPTRIFQSSAQEASIAIREMARRLANFGKFANTSSEVNIRIETSTIDAHLSDNEWNNIMKNLKDKL